MHSLGSAAGVVYELGSLGDDSRARLFSYAVDVVPPRQFGVVRAGEVGGHAVVVERATKDAWAGAVDVTRPTPNTMATYNRTRRIMMTVLPVGSHYTWNAVADVRSVVAGPSSPHNP